MAERRGGRETEKERERESGREMTRNDKNKETSKFS